MMKKQRGQFFTKNSDVHTVMKRLLSTEKGQVLEPSAGAGDLVAILEKNPQLTVEGVELDTSLTRNCNTPLIYQDFFSYSTGKENQYDAVFGNPPYVAWKGLEQATKLSAASVKENYTDKTNLYHLFIDRCIDLVKPGGEIVFIVPKEWLYTSSANPLREKILRTGALTHVVDCGEEKLFDDADVPALLIFRYVKGIPSSTRVQYYASLDAALNDDWEPRFLYDRSGRLLLLSRTLGDTITHWGTVKDSYRVRVGYVTGADKVFRLPEGAHVEPSCVKEYVTTRGVEKFLDVEHIENWEDMPPLAAAYLLPYKSILLGRKIAVFNESNWWKYGAIRNKPAMESSAERFYSYGKTRSATPFFRNDAVKLFTGGLLGLFRTPDSKVTVDTAVKVLNSPGYRRILEAMFLTTGNKVVLQPATLEDAPFPRTEKEALSWLKTKGSQPHP